MKLQIPLLVLGKMSRRHSVFAPEGEFTKTEDCPVLRVVEGAAQTLGQITSVYRESGMIMGNIRLESLYTQVGHELTEGRSIIQAEFDPEDYNVRGKYWYFLKGSIHYAVVRPADFWHWKEQP